MDKIVRRLPIREHKLKNPVVFVANIGTTYFKAMGT